MYPSKYLLLCGIFFLASFKTNAQSFSCPPNLDFESGNYSHWEFFTGSCCPISTSVNSGPVSGRHSLTTGTGVDPYGGFPIVAPGGGNYSLKLGNSGTGAQAEKARYYIQVPASVNNYSLIYRYAVVFQDPNHAISEQPRFEVKAYDSATGNPINCAQFTYISSSNLPGFMQSSQSSSVWYKSWTTASLDLSGLGGQTVIVDFASADCDLGGHFGYGYVDMSCGLFQIQAVNCNNAPTTTLNAPPGFQSYTWMDASFSNTIDTGQSITIPTPGTSTQFNVILTPYTGFGCPDTLTTTITISNLSLSTSNDTLICADDATTISAVGTANGTSNVSYSWTPAAGLSCTTCATPVATPPTSTKYYVTITDQNGCTKTDSVQVDISPDAVISKTDIACFGAASGTASVNVINGNGPYTYSWNTTPPQTGTSVNGLVAGNYTVVVTDNNGCTATRPVNITQPSSALTITLGNLTNVSCYGLSDGGINTSVAGGNPPYSYIWDNNTALNTHSINNITAGSHTLIVTDANGCKDTLTVTVTQPVQEPAPIGPGLIQYCVNEVATPLTAIGTNLKWYVTPAGGTGTTVAPTPSTAVPGTYKWYVSQTLNGCEGARDSITVIVHPLPVITFSPSAPSICLGESVTLNVAGGNIYNWKPHPTLNTITGDSVIATPATTTTYTVVVSDMANCTDSASVTVVINPNPEITVNKDTAICYLQSALLHVQGALNYTWEPAGSLSCANCPDPIATPSATTTYTVVGSNIFNCKDTADITVTVHPLPILSISADTAICYGDTATLHAKGASYYWWTPATALSCLNCANPTAAPAQTTHYTVKGTNEFGCFDSLKVKVTVVIEQPYTYSPDDTLCQGENLVLYATGGDQYQWIPSSGLDRSDVGRPTATPDSTIQYTVFVNQGNCYFDTGKISIFVYPQPEIEAGPDKILTGALESVKINIQAKDVETYRWTPTTGLDCFTCPSPNAFPSETTTYYITGTNGICKAIDSVTVNVGCKYSRVFMPNTFTPNDDGVNDRVFPQRKGTAMIKHFSIYNRWGELIFQRENMDPNIASLGWDGTYQGKPAPSDVYVYVIEALCDSGESYVTKGDITLVR